MHATQINQEDIDRSSTLTAKDLGKWCVTDNGCLFLKDTEEEARELIKVLTAKDLGKWCVTDNGCLFLKDTEEEEAR